MSEAAMRQPPRSPHRLHDRGEIGAHSLIRRRASGVTLSPSSDTAGSAKLMGVRTSS